MTVFVPDVYNTNFTGFTTTTNHLVQSLERRRVEDEARFDRLDLLFDSMQYKLNSMNNKLDCLLFLTYKNFEGVISKYIYWYIYLGGLSMCWEEDSKQLAVCS